MNPPTWSFKIQLIFVTRFVHQREAFRSIHTLPCLTPGVYYHKDSRFSGEYIVLMKYMEDFEICDQLKPLPLSEAKLIVTELSKLHNHFYTHQVSQVHNSHRK